MSRYPMQAFWIDATFENRVVIKPVTVESVYRRMDTHFAMFTTNRDRIPVKHSRPLCELATTPALALEKLPKLLTALESRPPLTQSGTGTDEPHGKTDSGAANSHAPQPQPEPITA